MARLVEGKTEHWLTPSRGAEIDLGNNVISAVRAAAPAAEPDAVDKAVAAAWACGRAYWLHLADRAGRPVPNELFSELDAATKY